MDEVKPKMEWGNLEKGKCPYCGENLIEDSEGMIKCSVCFFHITRKKVLSILKCRAEREMPGYIKKKWQNLHKNRCPVCSCLLEKSKKYIHTLECSSNYCEFKIEIDRMRELLNDPNHSCNKFHNVELNPYTYEPEPTKKRHTLFRM